MLRDKGTQTVLIAAFDGDVRLLMVTCGWTSNIRRNTDT
jgi:hypothetical protein